jgi:hypothetical protein
MKHPSFVLRSVYAACLVLLVSCGSRESGNDSAGDSRAAAGESDGPGGEASGGAATAASFEGLAIKPLPEGSKLQLRFTSALSAERNQVDKDPLGPRSNFKVSRRAELACRMVAGKPQGLGPDGPTAEQKAILDAAEAQSNEAGENLAPSPEMSAIEARIAACGEDEGCVMQAALDAASDPQQRAAAQAAEARNSSAAASMDDAASRVTAVYEEPNWQPLVLDVPPGGGGPPGCDGTITVDDKEVYRLGFDGGDMGEGVETRKGSTALADGAPFLAWYDLKRGGLIVQVQLSGIRGEVASVNVGGRKFSRNAGFGLNEDWARSAGEETRFRQDSGVTAVPGQWTFSLPITPAVHQGFGGKIDATIGVAPR